MTRPRPGAHRGRPRIDPNIKYADEIIIWTTAEQHRGLQLPMPSPNHAIAFIHRLHMCRAAIRAHQGLGFVTWDSFVIRRSDHIIRIEIKPRMDLSHALVDLDGNPIQPIEPLDDFQPALRQQARHQIDQYQGTHEIDPSRKLLDC